jgi:hypothetical protein
VMWELHTLNQAMQRHHTADHSIGTIQCYATTQ